MDMNKQTLGDIGGQRSLASGRISGHCLFLLPHVLLVQAQPQAPGLPAKL